MGEGSENKRLILIDNIETGHIDGKPPKRERQQIVTHWYLPKGGSLNFSPPREVSAFALSHLVSIHHGLTEITSCLWSAMTHPLTCLSFNAAWTEGLFSICWASLLFLALASCCCCCIEARIFTGIGCLFFSILVKLQGRTKRMFK